jgi:hypothetical protein
MKIYWNRRAFLKLIGLTAGSAALGFSSWSCSTEEKAPAANDQDTGGLTNDELDAIVALAITLFEPEDKSERAELDRTMRWWAQGRSSKGGHLSIYRNGLAATPAPSDTSATATENPRQALEREILEGIYSTAIGWKSLGYTTWPGVPSAPLEYTTRPHGPTRVTTSTTGNRPG